MRFLLSAFRWRYFATAPLQVCSVLFDIHAGGGERKIHTVGLHDVHNVQVQVVLHLQKFRVGVSQQVGGDQNVDAGIAKVCKLYDVGTLVGVRACVQHGLQVFHQLFQLRAGGAIGDTQIELVGPHRKAPATCFPAS